MDFLSRPVLSLALLMAIPALADKADAARRDALFRQALASIRLAAKEIRLDSLNPKVGETLEDSLAFLDTAFSPGSAWRMAFHDVKPTGPAEKREKSKAFQGALRYAKNIANGFIRSHLDTALQDSLLGPLDDFQEQEARDALAARMENLEKIEIKYGPNSAKLNLLEVGVNHFLLRGWPLFGLDDLGQPGPLEMVLAYSMTYVTPSWSEPNGAGIEFASAFEGGLRWYFLRRGWGENVLFPAYMSAGVLLAADEEGVFRNPFETAPRVGGFFSWGEIKAAVVYEEENPKVYLNRQFQLLPYFF